MDPSKMPVSAAIDHIKHVVEHGGPNHSDYRDLARSFEVIHKNEFVIQNGLSSRIAFIPEFKTILEKHWRIFRTTATMQGFAYVKPNGYAGDFEIIERIYNKSITSVADLIMWDQFWQNNPAAEAVRNRSKILSDLVSESDPLIVLSVGCGPGLDVREAILARSAMRSVILLDNDERAIARAKANNVQECGISLNFKHRNALRYRSDDTVDLLWCSGLFDYLNDKTSVFLLKKFKNLISARGRVVIGNFSHDNPSRAYMEVVSEWILIHRSRDELMRLAIEAGFKRFEVEHDHTGVNLFLICYQGG
jgi:SAM-dependent methyltransferase